ncbi:asparagine synthetase B family protein [Stenotrophomonas sp. NPDC077464]|uniref:asparagine synthetase B family protein n=1 Tax=unclassified Stenotrophomonas TaxID=196198 RepID=UPI0037D08685
MSAIAGSWIVHRDVGDSELGATARRLTLSLAHRGGHRQPLARSGVGLALAAVSGSDVASNIAESPDGRYVVVTGGAVGDPFNRLGAAPAHAIARLLVGTGTVDALRRTPEAVSVAIWDHCERSLTLSRDRIGHSDLYYSCTAFGLVFSSELKTLTHECMGGCEVDPQAVSQLLRYGYIPAPATVYRGVYKLPAGTMRVFHEAQLRAGRRSDAVAGPFTPHWSLKHEAETRMAARASSPLDASVDAVITALEDAIGRSRSARTACLLSGGVDSSLITALLQRQSAAAVETISVGFDAPGHDESDWAAEVATHLRTRNTRLMMDDAGALRLVERAARVYCEPYADSSAIPTLLAAEAAGASCRTILTGDGGDELFFGHAAYVKSLRNHGMARRVPGAVRRVLGACAARNPERARLGGLAALISEAASGSLAETYLARVSRWRDPSRALRAAHEPPRQFLDPALHPACAHRAELLLFLDQSNELSEGLMTKSDRAFGAHGVHARSPFLDPEVLSLAWGMPFEHKLHHGETKAVLKRALERFLPEHYVRRPKKGFGAPVARWLKGPLRDWAEDLLDPVALRDRGILDETVVAGMWRSFLDGNRKYHTHLWPVLMFQAWDREWNGPNAGAQAFHARINAA